MSSDDGVRMFLYFPLTVNTPTREITTLLCRRDIMTEITLRYRGGA